MKRISCYDTFSEAGRDDYWIFYKIIKFSIDEVVKSQIYPFLSFPRRRESSDLSMLWIPAFAGMTVCGFFARPTTLVFFKRKIDDIRKFKEIIYCP